MPTMAKSEQGSGVFQLEEATIADLHHAIRSGLTTCVAVVQHYIDRVRAFNGVSSMLVTEDGAAVPPAQGPVRAQAPIGFPTTTVKASTLLPDLDKYRGPPLEYGRMEATASDPSVQQQFGMIVGIPSAGQVNALATLNIRGERSVTCRGDFDRHPSLGPLPPAAPPVCEYFRHLPDALEQAAALDARYDRAPDLKAMPMYGVVFSFTSAMLRWSSTVPSHFGCRDRRFGRRSPASTRCHKGFGSTVNRSVRLLAHFVRPVRYPPLLTGDTTRHQSVLFC